MARQTPVRSYNTVHNKIQSARSAFSSKFFVILAIVIAGTVVFFSGRFYLAEKNGTTSGGATVASSSDVSSDGTTTEPSLNGSSPANNTSSGSNSSQGGTSGNGGQANSNGSGSSSSGGSAPASTTASGCETPSVPAAACTTMRNIESNGLVGNPLVATTFPKIPETAAFIIDDTTWAQSSDSSGTVKMAAFYDGIVDRTLLQMNLQGGNWVVTSFTQL